MSDAPGSIAEPTLGAELRATLRLAAPLIFAQASVMLMGIVDTAVVGRHSPLELGAVSLGNSLSFALLVFGMGFAMALEPLVSQALGAGDAARAWAWWRVGRWVALAAGVPLTALAIASGPLSELLGVDALLAERATDYLIARGPAMLVFLLYMAARSLLQSHQRVAPMVYAALVANVFNLLADLALVDGDAFLTSLGLPTLGLPALGGVGAGVATSVSTIVMAVWLLVDIRGLRPPPDAAIPKVPVRRLFELGVPLGLMLATEYLVFSGIGVLAATIDEVSAGAHQIALHCSTMTFMASVGIGGAASARIGNLIGRGLERQVRRAGAAALGLSMGIMTVTAAIFLLFGAPLAGLFAPDEPEVRGLAATLVGIAGLYQLFDGLQVVSAGALRGAGDVRRPFIITAVGYWGVGFPTAAALAFEAELGAPGLWYGLTAGLGTVGLALVARFWWLSGRMKER